MKDKHQAKYAIDLNRNRNLGGGLVNYFNFGAAAINQSRTPPAIPEATVVITSPMQILWSNSTDRTSGQMGWPSTHRGGPQGFTIRLASGNTSKTVKPREHLHKNELSRHGGGGSPLTSYKTHKQVLSLERNAVFLLLCCEYQFGPSQQHHMHVLPRDSLLLPLLQQPCLLIPMWGQECHCVHTDSTAAAGDLPFMQDLQVKTLGCFTFRPLPALPNSQKVVLHVGDWSDSSNVCSCCNAWKNKNTPVFGWAFQFCM